MMRSNSGPMQVPQCRVLLTTFDVSVIRATHTHRVSEAALAVLEAITVASDDVTKAKHQGVRAHA